MGEFRTLEERERIAEYDSVPVVYCPDCLSLRILSVDGMDYCDQCGCTDVREANIHDWERMYELRYGRKFTDKQ